MISSPDELSELSDEAQKALESFKPREVEAMNRRERKSRLKFFSKQLKELLKKKPFTNVNKILSEEQEAENTYKLRTWMVRYEILKRKVDELTN